MKIEWGKFFRNMLFAALLYWAVTGGAALAGFVGQKWLLWLYLPLFAAGLIAMLAGKRVFAHLFLLGVEASVAFRYIISLTRDAAGAALPAAAIIVAAACLGIAIQIIADSAKKKKRRRKK